MCHKRKPPAPRARRRIGRGRGRLELRAPKPSPRRRPSCWACAPAFPFRNPIGEPRHARLMVMDPRQASAEAAGALFGRYGGQYLAKRQKA
jgi:hypothetical protein